MRAAVTAGFVLGLICFVVTVTSSFGLSREPFWMTDTSAGWLSSTNVRW